jgi:HAD superfamily hydrolase (TIGR01457 family)
VILLERYDSILFDLDGVVYRGNHAVEHADEVIERLRGLDRPGFVFVTNNSSRSAADVAAKLRGLGIETSPDEIVTSAAATASLIASQGAGSAFVIGEMGIREALQQRGVRLLEDEPASADWVVVGFDRTADYAKLRTAALLVQRGAKLVATNADASYPAPDGVWPGAGALLAVITTTTGAVPEVVGKPHAPLFEEARDRAGGGSTLFVGDRLDTDVAGASALDMDTLLVFSGISRPQHLLHADVLPTFVGRDVRALSADAPDVRRATGSDEPAIEELLRACDLPDEAAGERIPSTIVAASGDGAVVGAVALELDGELALLRSLVVAEPHRGELLGTLLTAHAVREARRSGAREVYLATETAEAFFAGFGFERVGGLGALPMPFLARMAACCAETAATMRLTL